MENRLVWLDRIKGFAILCTLLGHTIERTLVGLRMNSRLLNCLNIFIYSFHMPLFFTAAGYLYAIRDRKEITQKVNLKSYIWKKFLDLFLPYTIFAPAVWLGKVIFADYVTNSVNLQDLLMMFIDPMEFLWFIYILFFVSVIIAVIDYKMGGDVKLTLIIVVAMVLSRNFITTNVKLIDRILYYPMFYYLGVIFYRCQKAFSKISLFASLLCFVASFLAHYTYQQNIILTMIVNTCGISFFMIAFNLFASSGSGLMCASLGKNTLYIYILHPIVLNLIRGGVACRKNQVCNNLVFYNADRRSPCPHRV